MTLSDCIAIVLNVHWGIILFETIIAILRLSWNLKDRYSANNSLSLHPILSQINPSRADISLKFHFKIILPSGPCAFVSLLSADHELAPARRKRPQCSAGGVQSMQVDGRLPTGQR
jgi:hypothetical protein